MARQKSALRKRLNIRWIRHAAFSAAARALPAIGRIYHVPRRAVRALEAATEILENVQAPVKLEVSESLFEQVLAPSRAHDTGEPESLGSRKVMLWRQTAILDGCEVAGHSLSILRAKDGALVNLKADPPNWNFGKPARLKPRAASPELHAIIQGVRSNYHFFGNEILPLIDYLHRMHPAGAPLTLVTPTSMPAFARDALARLCERYPDLRLLELGRGEKLVGARILWNYRLHSNYEWMPADRNEAERLAEILAGAGATSPQPTRLFVSRRDARIRQLREESEVEAMLASLGFAKFVPGAASLQEQVAAFRAADIIVAVHGAALTNLLFCKRGTTIIEIFPGNFIKSTYLWLAHRLGLRYQAVIGEPGDYLQNFGIGEEGMKALRSALADLPFAAPSR